MSQSTLTVGQERAVNAVIAKWMRGEIVAVCRGSVVFDAFVCDELGLAEGELFTRSLDSMALAEARLTDEQLAQYFSQMHNILFASGVAYWRVVIASASVRALALVEVIQGETK